MAARKRVAAVEVEPSEDDAPVEVEPPRPVTNHFRSDDSGNAPEGDD